MSYCDDRCGFSSQKRELKGWFMAPYSIGMSSKFLQWFHMINVFNILTSVKSFKFLKHYHIEFDEINHQKEFWNCWYNFPYNHHMIEKSRSFVTELKAFEDHEDVYRFFGLEQTMNVTFYSS